MSMEIGNKYANYSTYNTRSADTANTAKRQSASDYYEQLRDKYDCVKDEKINISPIYLQSCANDPKKAKELEENLSYFKEGYESGYQNALANAKSLGATLVDYSESWDIDAKGNVTMIASSTVKSGDDTKVQKDRKTEQEKKLAEKREKKRLEAKKAEQKAKEEKLRVKMNKLDTKA